MRRLLRNRHGRVDLGGVFDQWRSNRWRYVALTALLVGLAAVPALGQADWYVKTTGNDSNDGQSWNTAFATIQKAVTSAIQFGGYEVWVAQGTYAVGTPISIPWAGSKIPLKIYAGFEGTESFLAQRDWVAHPTVIDGGNAVESVIEAAWVDLIDGFEITGGTAGSWGTGGAIDLRGCGDQSPQPVLRNLVIRGNGGDTTHPPAYYDGGGIYIEDCSPWIINTTFSGNRVWAHGGAVFARDTDDTPIDTYPKVLNSTFTGNHADVNGGAVGVYRGSITVDNSILWGDTAGDGVTHELYGATLSVSSSDIDSSQSGWDGVNGNIQADPLLAGVGRFHLRAGSPCIDSGNDLLWTTFTDGFERDFDGDERFLDGGSGSPTIDMGADEYVPGQTKLYFVDGSSGSDANSGLDWSQALATIQAAVTKGAGFATEIWVRQGHYDLTSSIVLGPANANTVIYGGFTGTEVSESERSSDASLTVIDGQSAHNCVSIDSSSSPWETANTILDGLTLDSCARGVRIDYASGTQINNCRITGAVAGGVYAAAGDVAISDSYLGSNTGGLGGAVLVNGSYRLTVTDSLFVGNSAVVNGTSVSGSGGAIAASTGTIERSRFFSNVSYRHGGAIYDHGYGDGLLIRNSLFSGNHAGPQPGDYFLATGGGTWGAVDIVNSTFAGNGAKVGAGGVSGAASIINSILWGNTGATNVENTNLHCSNGKVLYSDVGDPSYSDVTNCQTPYGNISADPLFTNAEGADSTVGTVDDDLTLQAGSPAIDAGDSTALVIGSVDLAGNPRHNDDDSVVDTGYGPEPMIDMGAYERQASTPQPTYDLAMSVAGSGSTAPPAGVHSYPAGSVVSVSASASSGWMFDGWTGWVEDPTSASTSVTMNWDRSVTANFVEAGTVTVDLQGDGVGTVTSSPAGINCPGDCDHTWQTGTAVTLSASTDPGTVFDGWIGSGCSGSGTCELTIAEDEPVVALCNLEGSCGLGDDLTLDSISVETDQNLEACSSITVGSGLVIEPPSHVVLRSGSVVVLENGFTVLEGASLTIEIYPDVGLESAISVTKSADPAAASEGESITYTISVENTGEVPLAEVSVVDAKCDAAPVYQSGDDGDGSLEVGETWVYQCSGTAESVTFVNAATATFEDAIGVEVSDSGTAEVTVDVAACTAGARFADLGDGTVYDCWTELIWLENARCVDLPGTDWRGYADWSTAATAAAALGDGICGLSDGSSPGDWRLPTMSELCGAWSGSWASGVGACDETQGLINDNFTPSLSNAAGDGAWSEGDPFTNVPDNSYWSSDGYEADMAWAAYFYSSVDINTWFKTENLPVWPVRGTQ